MAAEIREIVFETPLFDDHEHLTPLPELSEEQDSYESFFGYAVADLLVSGGPHPPGSYAIPEEPGPGRDKAFFSAWKQSRNTAYCRAVETACRDILGLEYTEENAALIGKRLHEMKGAGAGAFAEEILARRAGIRWVVHDSVNRPDQVADGQFPPFVYVNYRDDPLLAAANRDVIMDREALWGRSIHTLDQLVEGLMDSITSCLDTGRVTAFKIGLAYNRDLDFGFPCKADAEKAFNHLMIPNRGEKVLRHYERVGEKRNFPAIPQLSGKELRPLHDYLVHVYIQRAQAEHIPVQIHTGYLAGINGDLRSINPMQLVPLFLHYRTVKFDLFHAGWPYTDEMGAIGKQYPNVWLSLCWAWAMNSITTQRALDSWLDGVPFNKIVGFGGDTHHPVSSYGYAMQAREGIARVLESRISRGDMDPHLAEEAARAVLFENGRNLHGLPEE